MPRSASAEPAYADMGSRAQMFATAVATTRRAVPASSRYQWFGCLADRPIRAYPSGHLLSWVVRSTSDAPLFSTALTSGCVIAGSWPAGGVMAFKVGRLIRWWIRRYLVADIVGTTMAMAAVLGARRAGASDELAALWGSIAETVGFYAVMLVRDLARQPLLPTLRGMLVEFGPAEILDTLVVRPVALYAGLALTGSVVAGTVGGKLAADLVFDVIVALCYRLRMRLFARASVVRVQGRVQLDAGPLAGAGLQGAGDRIPPEEQTVHTRQLAGLHHAAVRQGQFGAGRDVAARLDHAVVAQGDADAGVCAEQAALADADLVLAAAREGALNRGAGADIRAVADHHALHDAALDHRGAERARVEVDEALVHDRRAAGQVGAEPDPVGVRDPHP